MSTLRDPGEGDKCLTETFSLFSQGFMPALEKLPTEEYAKVMVTFTVAFIAVLFLKVNGCMVWWDVREERKLCCQRDRRNWFVLLSQICQSHRKLLGSPLGCNRSYASVRVDNQITLMILGVWVIKKALPVFKNYDWPFISKRIRCLKTNYRKLFCYCTTKSMKSLSSRLDLPLG